LDVLGWPLYELDDYEADDIMGTFAVQAKAKDVETYLVTSDLDVLQLINSHTHIYTLKKGLTNIELFNEASFREKYGIGAHQWIDTKALKGDSSDNIPGVAGIGEKTAIELIQKYDTLENVYAHLDEIKPTLRAKLEKDRDMAMLSKKLVTLMCDAPIELDFKKAEVSTKVTPEFVELLKKLEFRNLLRQVELAMTNKELRHVEPPKIDLPQAEKQPFAADDFKPDQPLVLALNPEGTELWLSRDQKMYTSVPLESLDDNVKAIIASAPAIGHDLKGIFRALLTFDFTWPGMVEHDTRIGAFLLNSLERQRELSDVVGQPIDLGKPEQVIPAIWQAYKTQHEQFAKAPKLAQLAKDIEFPSIYLLAKIEHRGILLDSSYLRTMSQQFDVTITEFEQKIYELAGEKFNINSPSQLATILFEKMGLPTFGVKKGKTGYSTDVRELEKLREHTPLVDVILQYREYAKLKSTYIDSLPKLVDKEGRLHTTFALDVAATGRLSSHDPNLQNIPTRTKIGQAIRTAFVPARGSVFVNADYSQFELRLEAVMAGDEVMMDAFNNDQDIHAATAAQIYEVPLAEVTKEQRYNAKAINFGIIYGMSAHGLSAATKMNFKESGEFIKKYFELHPNLRTFMDRLVTDGLKDGYVETMFGRRRPTPDLKSSNFVVREAAKRAAINMPTQGTEADLMKLAMLEVEKKLEGLGEQILQVHDSILVECPEKNAEQVAHVLKETMENVYTLKVPLKVDTKIGTNWGEL
ncbi:MAG TPA: DNA polymerase I, partial [Candidatus Acidoferrum sp.]|nr:DNA polymerase I [Candidatus Acidoferrum sp.]